MPKERCAVRMAKRRARLLCRPMHFPDYTHVIYAVSTRRDVDSDPVDTRASPGTHSNLHYRDEG